MWLLRIVLGLFAARLLPLLATEDHDAIKHISAVHSDAGDILVGNKEEKRNKLPDLCSNPEQLPPLSPDEYNRAIELMVKHNITMKIEEVAFLYSLLEQANTKTYFEYGMGGSTRLACHIGGDRLRIYAVDSAIEWVRRVNSTECVQRGARQGRITVRAVNIGPVGLWGFPNGTRFRHLWPRYSRAIASVREPVDLVLVDGRFRVACALNAFLRHPEATVLLHDGKRSVPDFPYTALCEVADRVKVVRRMVQLRLKPGVTRDKLQEMIRKYDDVAG